MSHTPDEEALFNRIYAALLAAARKQRREQGGFVTYNTTALVNEAYIRLYKDGNTVPKSEGAVYVQFAKAMRHFFLEEVERRNASKRGSGQQPTYIHTGDTHQAEMRPERLRALDEVLSDMEAHSDPHLREAADVVSLRYFLGYTHAEAAEIMDIPVGRVRTRWALAKTHLRQMLDDQPAG